MDTVTTDVRYEVYKRDNYQCQNPFCKTPKEKQYITLHHCIFKSQYREPDRDSPWNLMVLCGYCHRSIHRRPDRNVGLREYCVEIAIRRRTFGTIPEQWATGQYWRRRIKRAYVARVLGREREFVLTPSQGLLIKNRFVAISRFASCLEQITKLKAQGQEQEIVVQEPLDQSLENGLEIVAPQVSPLLAVSS